LALFYYEGKKFDGEKISGIFEAENKNTVAKKIKNKGFFPVKIKKIKTNSFSYVMKCLFNKVRHIDLAMLCEQFTVMLDAGVNLLESLTSIAKQTENRKMRDTLIDMTEHIKSGNTLTEACRNHPYMFSEVFNYMIEAGELSGNLSDVLKVLSVYYFDIARQNEKIKNAMTYPCILGVTSLFAVSFLTMKVLPVYVSIFSSAGAELPKVTKALMFISSNIVKIFLITFVLFFVLLLIMLKYMESEKTVYQIDSLKLSIPFVGQLIKKSVSSKVARILYILVSSGIPLLKALEVAGNTVKNQVIKKELVKIRIGLKEGKNLSELMTDKIFPPIMIKLITTGEESGSLEQMLEKAASFCENQATTLQERWIVLVEPVIIIVLTIIISFIVIAVLMPMFDIYNLF
jgi:type IV pilus assembly protein PilC